MSEEGAVTQPETTVNSNDDVRSPRKMGIFAVVSIGILTIFGLMLGLMLALTHDVVVVGNPSGERVGSSSPGGVQ